VFPSLGWGELLVLAVVGMILFGPDRLPRAAADAARMLRQLRAVARGAAADLKAELGPDLANLDLTSLDPRRIVQSALFDDDEPVAGEPPAQVPAVLGAGERPPYDVDAT
jgi:sec-independent protein translocase protein TatB